MVKPEPDAAERARQHGEIVCGHHHRNRDPFRDSHPAAHLGRAGGHFDHGHLIDEQMSETMAEAGIAFLAAQFILAIFIWKFSNRGPEAKIKNFPGGAKGLVIAAFLVVGIEVLALGVFGVKAWADVYLTPPCGQCHADSGASRTVCFLFPLSRSRWNLRTAIHPELINESKSEFLWPGYGPRSGFQGRHRDRRDGDSGEQGNPSAYAFERSWTFLFCAGTAGAAGFCSWVGCFACTSPQPRSASTKLSAPSFVAWATTT